ncbi:MAG: translation initiation factor IF-2 [Lachnospiraceae bacterium]|nr:translation initiation factor IF-2 [Lachnospiraceae bacterium]
MAKRRVYEVAKEMDVIPKELTEYIKNNIQDIKSHMSYIEEDVIERVKKEFVPTQKLSEVEAQKPAAPKKKKSITAVYNPVLQEQESAHPVKKPVAPKPPAHPAPGKAPVHPGGKRPIGTPTRFIPVKVAKPQTEENVSPETKETVRDDAGAKAVTPADTTVKQAEKPVDNTPEVKPADNKAEVEVKTDNKQTADNTASIAVNANPVNEKKPPERKFGLTGEKVIIPVEEKKKGNSGDRDRRHGQKGERAGEKTGEKNGKKIYTTSNSGNRYGGDRNNTGRNEGGRGDNRFNKDRQGKPGQQSQIRDNSANQAAAVADPGRKSGRKGKDKRDNKDFDKNSRHAEQLKNLEKTTGYKQRNKTAMTAEEKEEKTQIKEIELPEHLTIGELASRMKVTASEIIKKLFEKGKMYTMNSDIAYDEAESLALEFNFIASPEERVDAIAELLKEEDEDDAKLVKRPPVVCVMGHVDHGKTSLLDAIRDTKVTDKEAGGITQAIGAYMVRVGDQKITFIDTPGHEAFTAMRMRGANSTDIAILVVAADDGVMPQTVEAINHAKAAGVEIIVAVNKIDKPSANIEKVKQELTEYELIPEDWGGSTVFCPVSARTKEGIDNLLEMILLTADILELKANPKRNARGIIIEAQLDKGRGPVATVLVQKGTLKVGQPVACGSSYGKVRAMIDDRGHNVKEARPSTPVEILGLNSVPNAGEVFVAMDSEKEAKAFADTYIAEGKNKLVEESRARVSLDDLFSQIQSGNMKELDIIVKADVQGSVEAVKQSLVKLSNDEVVVKVIHGGVGAINESDVILASASNAIIIGFNVRPDAVAKSTADREGVDVRLYKVIYNAIEDVEAAMKGMLDPIYEEKVIGHAEVRQIFKASGIGNIAGSYVLDGVFKRGCKVRVTREGEQIFDGDLASLKRFKDDVKEVKAGFECGLVLDGFTDYAEMDVFEAYEMVEVPR